MFGKWVLAVLLGLFSLLSACLASASQLDAFFAIPQIPRQQIVITADSTPVWIGIWQDARRHAAQGDYASALGEYEHLLDQKEDAAQARWEYAALLL